MKITPNDYAAIVDAIVGMPVNATERQRWDALWRAVDSGRLQWSTLEPYLDAHIDTALRRISAAVTV